jgi:hypothetical protein
VMVAEQAAAAVVVPRVSGRRNLGMSDATIVALALTHARARAHTRARASDAPRRAAR